MASLSNFRPSPSMVQDIKRELVKAGANGDAIPVDWLEAIVAATFKWVATKPQGLEQVSNLLGLKCIEGRLDTNYELLDSRGIPSENINPSNIYFLEGCMVNGYMVPKSSVRVNEKAKDQCQECGSFVHCTKEIFNHRKDDTETFCNACLIQTDDLRAREKGDMSLCVDCPDTSCVHNYIHLRGTNEQHY